MKLPDFLRNTAMNALRADMGIPPDQFGSFRAEVEPGRLTLEELDKLTSGQGIDINFGDLTVLPDGTLAYKDSRVLLYIRDHHARQGEITPPKYHFYNCRTLTMMRRSQRFERYVVATETTGTFYINIIENNIRKSERYKLGVCQNCLHELPFEGFSLTKPRYERLRYVADFLPERFFSLFPRSLIIAIPTHTAITAPLNTYPENWGEISRAARQAANWTCPKCKLALAVHKKKYLHVHHRDGVKSNNVPSNLEVLCLGCHAEEPQHQSMKNTPVYKDFLRDTGWKLKKL